MVESKCKFTFFKLLGYSEPEFVTIDDNDENVDVNYLEDLGPNFKHTYEVINLGHQTVHNAQVFNQATCKNGYKNVE